jgi:pyrroloquinoline quinone biosynthesis protein B
MKAVVLGAAAGGGYPQWNCSCEVCALAWRADPRVRRATQSSLAISADGVSWILLNASPDIGAQIAATSLLWPRDKRHSPIAAAFLTNADIDHVAGLLSLREGHSFPLHAAQPVHSAIFANPIFGALKSITPVQAEFGTRYAVAGLEIELVAVPGKAPLYLEGDNPEIGIENGEAVAIIARSAGTSLVYMPGCAELTRGVLDLLRGADVALFDGTLFTDDEMIRSGVGSKTGRRMGHVPITGMGGSLDVLTTLSIGRKIYTHINNTNPIWIDGSPERTLVTDAGVEVAYDGMEIAL